MAMIGKVLRMRHREKKSVREIVKATSLARNTVRKYLRIDKAEAPKYRRPEVALCRSVWNLTAHPMLCQAL